MRIRIENQPCGYHMVYADGEYIGDVSKFCCGIDFRPKGYDVIFSILKVRYYNEIAVANSIRAILNINIPDGHWNFNPKIADSVYSLIEYQELINNHKGKICL